MLMKPFVLWMLMISRVLSLTEEVCIRHTLTAQYFNTTTQRHDYLFVSTTTNLGLGLFTAQYFLIHYLLL